MPYTIFSDYFQNKAQEFLLAILELALKEDGIDLTSNAIFSSVEHIHTQIIAKEQTLVSGLPVIPLIMQLCSVASDDYYWKAFVGEGTKVEAHTVIAEIIGPAQRILQAERTILNFISHVSGITTLTKKYVDALEGSGIVLLDTRKTLPGLRYPAKYAVLCGGGKNHRHNLEELLLIKDNHIDTAGSIDTAVQKLRNRYTPCPLIEVECRTITEVMEAVNCYVDRIMLDNMSIETMHTALAYIPQTIEVEISGNITLENIQRIAKNSQRKPNYISVGCITKSAPAADFSLSILRENN